MLVGSDADSSPFATGCASTGSITEPSRATPLAWGLRFPQRTDIRGGSAQSPGVFTVFCNRLQSCTILLTFWSLAGTHLCTFTGKNNGSITRHRYRSVIDSSCVDRLLWRETRNVIAGHSWCKGRGPVARLGDRPFACPGGPPSRLPASSAHASLNPIPAHRVGP